LARLIRERPVLVNLAGQRRSKFVADRPDDLSEPDSGAKSGSKRGISTPSPRRGPTTALPSTRQIKDSAQDDATSPFATAYLLRIYEGAGDFVVLSPIVSLKVRLCCRNTVKNDIIDSDIVETVI
jgi:hypothetical protein